MNKSLLCASAILALAATQAEASDTAREKCYGIAKAGKNDCSFKGNSCAGTAAKDNEPEAWVYVKKGECEKMGGKLTAPEEKK
ncbi:MAG: DUF2282 domain-containing protein [Proteobacteria bacterium]|nr:DUF2282 domain-containing protein [Pseudomonadota bacterium]